MKIPKELELLKQANAYLRNVKARHKNLYDEVGTCEKIECDVLHHIELNKFNRTGCCRTIRFLQKTLKQRRAAKEEKEILGPIIELLNKYPKLVDEMSAALGKVKRIVSDQGSRVYKPRILEDMEISGQHFDTEIEETAREKAPASKEKVAKLKKRPA